MTSPSDITRTQIPLRLNADLVTQIDARREVLGISRNQWIENMVTWCLANTTTITSRGGEG